MPFLVSNADILITTSQQPATDTEHQKQPPAAPDSLMMSAGATPLSIYLKISKPQTPIKRQLMQTPQPNNKPNQLPTTKQQPQQSPLEEDE